MINKIKTYGTSSPRPYRGTSGRWLEAPDAFVGSTKIRGWPRGGSAENAATLTIYTGGELIPSWDRCAAAVRRVAEARMVQAGGGTTWVDTFNGRRIAELLGQPEPKYCTTVSPPGYRSATDAAVAWVIEHALGEWRFDEVLRLVGDWHENYMADTSYPVQRTPEEIADAVISGETVSYRGRCMSRFCREDAASTLAPFTAEIAL